MRRNKRKVEEKKELIIYILLSPADKNFIINYCAEGQLRETYRHNITGRRAVSQAFIEELAPQRPCVFVLEKFTGTKAEATNLLLVWTKILLERGYKSYNHETLIEMSECLYYGNQQLYETKKMTDLEQLLACPNCQIPTYHNETCENYTIGKEPLKCHKETNDLTYD